MKVFGEDGNCLGEFISDRIEDSIENVSTSFSVSWLLGILCFLWQPIWTIFVIVLWLILKSIFTVAKLLFKSLWWIIRMPFCLLFARRCPKF